MLICCNIVIWLHMILSEMTYSDMVYENMIPHSILSFLFCRTSSGKGMSFLAGTAKFLVWRIAGCTGPNGSQDRRAILVYPFR